MHDLRGYGIYDLSALPAEPNVGRLNGLTVAITGKKSMCHISLEQKGGPMLMPQ